MQHSSPQPRADSFTGLQRLTRALGVTLGVFAATILTLVGVSIAAALAGPDSPTTSTTSPMLAVAPGGIIGPGDVAESIAVHYRAAVAHSDAFAAVPCFCGCQEMLGHRHLLDCYLRPGSSDWEAHAAGCGVCLGEAQQVEGLLASGVTDGNDLGKAVIAQWGDPYQANQ